MKRQTLLFILSSLFCIQFYEAQAQCPGETEVTVQIVTDFYGSETTWSLTDISGSPEYATGGPYTDGGSSIFTENVCVPTDSHLTFTIFDTYGDGICCGYGNGSYMITAGGFTVASGGAFTSSETVSFLAPPKMLDAAVTAINMDFALEYGNYPITVNIGNSGINTITSLDLYWSINDGAIYKEPLTLTLAAGGSQTITLSQMLHINQAKIYELEVWIENPNGMTDENTSNDMLEHDVVGIMFTTDKKVLLEEYSATWCGYCPDGELRAADIVANNPNVAIWLSGHHDDIMESPNMDVSINAYSIGYPSGAVDRFKFGGVTDVGLNRGQWASAVDIRKDHFALAALHITNNFDPATRNLTVGITTNFMLPVEGEYRLNCYVVEDNVTGTSFGYNQANFFSGDPDYIGHPFYSEPHPIIGYEHRNVIRELLGGPWGQAGSIPDDPASNTPYFYEFTYNIPAGYDESEIFLVATVQKYNPTDNEDRRILNALETPLNSTNELPIEVLGNSPVIAQITAFLEGPYDVATGEMNTTLRVSDLITTVQPYNRPPWTYTGVESVTSPQGVPYNAVDWVLIEARNASDNNVIAESRAAWLLKDGRIVDVEAGSEGVHFSSLNEGSSYYLVIRHRNHLAIMSANPITLPNDDPYDFTIAATQAMGEGQQKEVASGIFALHAGDFDSNGTVTVSDFNLYQTQASLINMYVDGDSNLDKNVTVGDFNLYQGSISLIGVNQVRY